MAQMESFEAANEFGIAPQHWADYDARKRSDDIYLSCLANVFDALRIADDKTRYSELDSIAKTLIIYSRSAASKHLKGVEKTLNQLYSAALYYIADRPATAYFLARSLHVEEANEEEMLLRDFLAHDINLDGEISFGLAAYMHNGNPITLQSLIVEIGLRRKMGLENDPRQFIAASLALSALKRFANVNVWTILRSYTPSLSTELWQPFLFSDKAFSMWEFLPSQITALSNGLLDADKKAVSLQMPTSAGKTSLCEILIFHEVKHLNRKVLFLVPFRALAAEIENGMSGRLGAAGVRVTASYGGNLPTRSETSTLEDVDVLIVTPEKFVALTQVLPGLPAQFETIVCDEGHLIDDDSRGLPYELLLTKLKGSSDGVARKIIFLSAILPNVSDIHRWLGGDSSTLAVSDYKPVDTDYAFLRKVKNERWELDVNPFFARPKSYFLKDFLTKDDFRFFNLETNRKNLISGWNTLSAITAASALKARRNGPVAVFTTARGNIGILGRKLLELLNNEAEVTINSPRTFSEIAKVREFCIFLFGQDYLLCQLLKHGIGYHHGHLPQEMRRCMEDSISNSYINILLCTSTLAEGVNLPIRTLVVHTLKRFSEASNRMEDIERRNIKNIIGRVGRAGKETRGRVVFANEGDRSLGIAVLKGEGLEPANGRLYELITLIQNHLKLSAEKLTNQLMEAQHPWFLELIDGIDQSIIELVPDDIDSNQISACIDELLERTLASQQGSSEDFRKTLQSVFNLRGSRLQEIIPRDSWGILKRSGTKPRLWKKIQAAELIASELWQSLEDPLDQTWIDSIILPLIMLKDGMTSEQAMIIIKVIQGWMSGLTYIEISEQTGLDIDAVLEIMCRDISFDLQESVSKTCQIIIATVGEDFISETAQSWSSLLQYGLGTLQQLDLYERSVSDRLGVWGIQRFLGSNSVRGSKLVNNLRFFGEDLQIALADDERVPDLCMERIISELQIGA